MRVVWYGKSGADNTTGDGTAARAPPRTGSADDAMPARCKECRVFLVAIILISLKGYQSFVVVVVVFYLLGNIYYEKFEFCFRPQLTRFREIFLPWNFFLCAAVSTSTYSSLEQFEQKE